MTLLHTAAASLVYFNSCLFGWH